MSEAAHFTQTASDGSVTAIAVISHIESQSSRDERVTLTKRYDPDFKIETTMGALIDGYMMARQLGWIHD